MKGLKLLRGSDSSDFTSLKTLKFKNPPFQYILMYSGVSKLDLAVAQVTDEFSLGDGPTIYVDSRNSPKKFLSYVSTGFLKSFLSLSN